jgi:phage-related protein
MRYTAWQVLVASDMVQAELKALPADMQARYLRIVDLLEEHGPQRVGMPHIRPLEDKLWEMRMQGRDGIARAIYVAASGRRLVVLHVFRKKTEKAPRSALDTARRRMKELDL